MTIDEQKQKFDLSDHNMLTATCTVKKTKTKINSKIEHTQKMTYVKINEETSRIHQHKVKIKINNNNNNNNVFI